MEIQSLVLTTSTASRRDVLFTAPHVIAKQAPFVKSW